MERTLQCLPGLLILSAWVAAQGNQPRHLCFATAWCPALLALLPQPADAYPLAHHHTITMETQSVTAPNLRQPPHIVPLSATVLRTLWASPTATVHKPPLVYSHAPMGVTLTPTIWEVTTVTAQHRPSHRYHCLLPQHSHAHMGATLKPAIGEINTVTAQHRPSHRYRVRRAVSVTSTTSVRDTAAVRSQHYLLASVRVTTLGITSTTTQGGGFAIVVQPQQFHHQPVGIRTCCLFCKTM